jgi:hypothetical protein
MGKVINLYLLSATLNKKIFYTFVIFNDLFFFFFPHTKKSQKKKIFFLVATANIPSVQKKKFSFLLPCLNRKNY